MASSVPADAGLQAAIDAAGSRYKLAQQLGVTPPAIQKWTRVPNAERCLQIERVLRVPRSVLRPDLYPPDRESVAIPEPSTMETN